MSLNEKIRLFLFIKVVTDQITRKVTDPKDHIFLAFGSESEFQIQRS